MRLFHFADMARAGELSGGACVKLPHTFPLYYPPYISSKPLLQRSQKNHCTLFQEVDRSMP